jgi:hypothetical protein
MRKIVPEIITATMISSVSFQIEINLYQKKIRLFQTISFNI